MDDAALWGYLAIHPLPCVDYAQVRCYGCDLEGVAREGEPWQCSCDMVFEVADGLLRAYSPRPLSLPSRVVIKGWLGHGPLAAFYCDVELGGASR